MASQFSPGELRSIIIAWIALSVALSISYIEGLFSSGTGGEYVVTAFIATFTAFVLHEMGHKFAAIRYGYVAHFQIWMWGIALTLITAVVFQGTLLFGAPGAVYIAPAVVASSYGYYSSSKKRDQNRDTVVISAAGPAINLAFTILFLFIILFAPFNSFTTLVALRCFTLNIGLGSFNMLPIPPIDGYKIFKGNIAVGLALALPLWGLVIYFFVLG
jgi:Zn-dependent protease